MKVLVLPGWYPSKIHPTNGDFVMYQTQGLIELGVDADVLFCDLDYRYIKFLNTIFPQNSYMLENNVPTYRRTGFFLPKKNQIILRKWLEQYDILFKEYVSQNGHPDIIHAHIYWGGIASHYLSQKYKIPYAVTSHSSAFLENTIPKWLTGSIRMAFNHAEKVMAVSKQLKKELEGKYVDSEIMVIPNFIDTNLFCLPLIQSEDSSPFIFIHVGDLLPIKRQDLLIKAFANLVKKGIDVKLQIVGDGTMKNELVNLVQRLHLTSKVNFLGHCTQEEVSFYLREANAFVLTSALETFGIVLIEAMASGLPVVSTKCGGPEDFILPFNGIICNDDTPENITDAMTNVIKNYESFDKNKIRKNIINNYSKKSVIKKLKRIYENMLP